jgi:hypothetical protein
MKTTQKSTRRTRIHNVLFFRDTPFRPQQVELKTRYKRRQKHCQKMVDQ